METINTLVESFEARLCYCELIKCESINQHRMLYELTKANEFGAIEKSLNENEERQKCIEHFKQSSQVFFKSYFSSEELHRVMKLGVMSYKICSTLPVYVKEQTHVLCEEVLNPVIHINA